MIISLTSGRHLVGYAKLRKLDRWRDKLFDEFRPSLCWRYCMVDISGLCWIRYVMGTQASALNAHLLTNSRMHWSSLGAVPVPHTPSASSRWQQSSHVGEGHLETRICCSVEYSTKQQGLVDLSPRVLFVLLRRDNGYLSLATLLGPRTRSIIFSSP